jgi:hypothetical protein
MGQLITLTSAKGAPGTTTTALALAYAWPRRVLLVDADVVAGSSIVAGHLQGRTDQTRGLLALCLTLRRQGHLTHEVVWGQTQQLAQDRDIYLLPGLADPVQAPQMSATWPQLAHVLRGLPDTDVLIDAGRLGAAFDAGALITGADTILAVARCALPDAYALRRRIPALTAHTAPGAVGLLTIGPKDPYPAEHIAQQLDIPLRGQLPHDPATARTFSHGHPAGRRHTTSPLVQAASLLAHTLLTLDARGSHHD